MMEDFRTSRQKGFTLTELMVVMMITALFVTIIMTFLFYFWRYSFVLDYTQESFTQRLNANDYLRDSLGSAVGLVNQNSLPDSHTNMPDPEITSNLFWKPIHAIPANYYTSSSTSAVPLIYYRRYSFNTAGNFILNGNQPYEDEYILYIDSQSKQIMLRSIANTFATGNRLKTSCPPSIANSSCPSDKILIDNVESVGLRYFSRSGNPIDWTSVWDDLNSTYAGPDFSQAEVVEITVNVNRKAKFSSMSSTKNSTIIRVSLRNY